MELSVWILVSCFVSTFGGLLMLFLWKQPKYIVYAYNRFLAYQVGFQNKYQEISPSITINYFERGNKNDTSQTLLLIHGFSSNKDIFCQLVRFLPKDIHVIAIDLPGHGGSTYGEAKDLFIMSFVLHIKKFITATGLSHDSLHMSGISMGGHIAGMYAVTFPKDLKSLILICPHGIENKCENHIREEFERTGKLIILPDSTDDFQKMIDFVAYKPIQIPRVVSEGIMQIRNSKFPVYKEVGENLQGENRYLLEKNIEKISTPLFLIWGANDKVLDVACVEVFQKKLPTPLQKVAILEKCGHAPPVERPRKTAKLIVDFIHSFK